MSHTNNYGEKARKYVADHYGYALEDVYLVIFGYVLGSYKALVSTFVPDGRYYEVTFDCAKGLTYIDEYMSVSQTQVHGDGMSSYEHYEYSTASHKAYLGPVE